MLYATNTMTKLNYIIQRIRRCRRALSQTGVQHVSVFGSVARGDAGAGSDIDAIIDPLPTGRFTLFDLVRTREILEGALHCRVDVVTARTIKCSDFADAIAREAVRAF